MCETLRSKTYDHYDVTIRCIHHGQQRQIQYIYKCKFKAKSHNIIEQLWSKTGDGTSNLTKAASKCDAARGISSPEASITTASGPVSYPVAEHRVIIALKSATSHRPFNAVHDKYYRMEVEFL